jgi:hypothetical protein
VEAIDDVSNCEHSFSGASMSAKPQATRPDIELHRIVFARRKTAGATSTLELTPRTRVEQRRKTPKRDRLELGRSGQRIAGR